MIGCHCYHVTSNVFNGTIEMLCNKVLHYKLAHFDMSFSNNLSSAFVMVGNHVPFLYFSADDKLAQF